MKRNLDKTFMRDSEPNVGVHTVSQFTLEQDKANLSYALARKKR